MNINTPLEIADSNKLYTKLVDLLKNGKTNEVQSFVKDAALSNSIDHSTGTTLLHLAATHNNAELITILLSSGHDIESKTTSGATPLLVAAMHKSYDAVKHLLAANANVLAADETNMCPLRILLDAWIEVPTEVAASLRERLRRSMDDANNESQLMKEALGEDLFERKLDCDGLIELAVDMGLFESIKVSVLYSNSYRERKNVLMKKLATVMTSPDAILESVRPIVEKLFEWRVINDVPIEPLQKIFQEGSEEAVQMLIDCGIDLHVKKFSGRDFLSQIFRNQNLDVRKVLKNRLGVHEQNQSLVGVKAISLEEFLERALDKGFLESIRFLLEYSCDSREIKSILMKKLTTIMTAPNAKLDCVKPIVEKLVDWSVIDENALEPLQKIFREGSEKAVRMLLDGEIDSSRFWTHIFQNSNLDVLKLLENRWSVNEKNWKGCTLLHYAVRFKPVSVVRRLLDLGADPNIARMDGRTPLFFAKRQSCFEMLLQRGANVAIEDKRSNTIFEVLKKEKLLMQIAVAFIASDRASTGYIESKILDNHQVFKMFYDSQCQLGWMQLELFFQGISLYALFKATDKELISYEFDTPDVVSRALEHMRKNKFNPYFISKIKKQSRKAVEFHPMKLKIAVTVAECVGVLDPHHLVVEKIVGFLTIADIFASRGFHV